MNIKSRLVLSACWSIFATFHQKNVCAGYMFCQVFVEAVSELPGMTISAPEGGYVESYNQSVCGKSENVVFNPTKITADVACNGTDSVKITVRFGRVDSVHVKLSCRAGFPLDLAVEKEINIRDVAVTFGNRPRGTGYALHEVTLSGSEDFDYSSSCIAQSRSISNNYTFYSTGEKTINITFDLQILYLQDSQPKSSRHAITQPSETFAGETEAVDLRIFVYDDSIYCTSNGSQQLYMVHAGEGAQTPTDSSIVLECLAKGEGCSIFWVGFVGGECGWQFKTAQCKRMFPSGHAGVFCAVSMNQYVTLQYFTSLVDLEVKDDVSLAWESQHVILAYPSPYEDSEIFEGQQRKFHCKTLLYAIVAPIVWKVEYKNSTEAQLLVDYTFQEKEDYRSLRKAQKVAVYISDITVAVSIDMFAIKCSAAYWNSDLFATSVHLVDVKGLPESVRPYFKQEVSVFYYVPETDVYLNCTVDGGYPQPRYSWRSRYWGILGPFGATTELLTGRNITGSQAGVFSPEEGDYVCIAKNSAGEASHTFRAKKRIPEENRTGTTPWDYTGIVMGTIALLIMSGIMAALWRKHCLQGARLSKLEIQLFEHGDINEIKFEKFAHENAPFMQYNKEYEIQWDDFTIGAERLGAGAYGIVYKGHLRTERVNAIAVKTVKPGVDRSVVLALLAELKVMIYLEKHDHIVDLIGACTKFLNEGRLYIMVEYCPLGSLEKFLRKNSKHYKVDQINEHYERTNEVALHPDGSEEYISSEDMVNWCVQIARGMQHLETKKVIHGDLAARNILLCTKHHVKISDFGLSRQLLNLDVYTKKSAARLPWRWMALESLKSLTFTSKSDVWSYGVTMWEIFTLGLTPYTGMRWSDEFVKLVDQNLRLSPPKYSTDEM